MSGEEGKLVAKLNHASSRMAVFKDLIYGVMAVPGGYFFM